ncbi:D-2-hydroxyacid dehydrogenase [Bifidobacterium aquikefiricola]|uniref:D-2-hydroxyacid dehydrogenase n=1 Tax=Bifidobacterium aquikefiricola TaxID=3059038 RepID=A0AB39U507_9BIFI
MADEMIVNCLPLTEEERERCRSAAPSVRQEFVGDPKHRADMIWPCHVPQELRESATAIIGNVPIDEVKECKNLKWLQTFSAGVNTYVGEGILAKGAKLSGASGAYGQAVGEHMFAMMWTLLKNIQLYRDNQSKHLWQDEGPVSTPDEVKVLVLGTGDIGSHFAVLSKAVGCYTAGVRRNASQPAPGIDDMHGFDELESLLPHADVIAMSLPSTPDTKHLINRHTLSLMKSNAIVLNVGRGDAIDADALAAALHDRTIQAAGLDVTEPEPLPEDHPLWSEPHCLITPHVAGGSHLEATGRKVIGIVVENLKRYANHQPLLNEA